MTTIATDGKLIAADGLVTQGYQRLHGSQRKIVVTNRRIFVCSGTASHVDQFIRWWIEDAADPKTYPLPRDGDKTSDFAMVDEDGLRYFGEGSPFSVRIPYPYAMGSGAPFADGAMLAGANPAQAVAIASRRDVYTGGEIQVVDIESALKGETRSLIIEPHIYDDITSEGIERALAMGSQIRSAA